MKRLIKNANLLDYSELQDIYIEDGMIRKIAPGLEQDNCEITDAGGKIVIGGLVNSHAHLDKSLIVDQKPYADEPPPVRAGWVRELKENFTKENIKERARRVAQMSLSHGVMGIRTNVDVDPVEGLKGIEALLELKEDLHDQLDLHVVAFCQEGFKRFPQTKELLAEALKMGADSIGGHTSIDADAKKEHIDIIFDLAQKFDVNIDFHADETGRPDDHMLPYLIEKTINAGYAGRVNAIHCCSLSVIAREDAAKDIEGIKKAGINVIVCPTAMATRQITEVKMLLEAGVNTALGSDNIQDLFNPLGSANMLEIALLLTYAKRFYSDPELQSIFNMLTANGVRHVSCERFAIKPGNRARMIITSLKLPTDIFRVPSFIERIYY